MDQVVEKKEKEKEKEGNGEVDSKGAGGGADSGHQCFIGMVVSRFPLSHKLHDNISKLCAE